MATKIEAARLATCSGVNVIIADGREPNILVKISQGEDIGTFFPAQVDKMESKKRWMLSGLASKGKRAGFQRQGHGGQRRCLSPQGAQ
jgi:glutamate 5-kinase